MLRRNDSFSVNEEKFRQFLVTEEGVRESDIPRIPVLRLLEHQKRFHQLERVAIRSQSTSGLMDDDDVKIFDARANRASVSPFFVDGQIKPDEGALHASPTSTSTLAPVSPPSSGNLMLPNSPAHSFSLPPSSSGMAFMSMTREGSSPNMASSTGQTPTSAAMIMSAMVWGRRMTGVFAARDV